ncbi:hypothetical protein EXIGLDRAFT_707374 [Exidia glandulosa HHB12029]|uniref:Uncharacterized protein n=1 Tax=Exidia glandulosa HHB12029 TaxID=1314781 RepID=A0A166AUT8_EXIGL|nr:hypothetical protein EXIGLDRAFT_707374 [Exidia glandulosa HHB12029]
MSHRRQQAPPPAPRTRPQRIRQINPAVLPMEQQTILNSQRLRDAAASRPNILTRNPEVVVSAQGRNWDTIIEPFPSSPPSRGPPQAAATATPQALPFSPGLPATPRGANNHQTETATPRGANQSHLARALTPQPQQSLPQSDPVSDSEYKVMMVLFRPPENPCVVRMDNLPSPIVDIPYILHELFTQPGVDQHFEGAVRDGGTRRLQLISRATSASGVQVPPGAAKIPLCTCDDVIHGCDEFLLDVQQHAALNSQHGWTILALTIEPPSNIPHAEEQAVDHDLPIPTSSSPAAQEQPIPRHIDSHYPVSQHRPPSPSFLAQQTPRQAQRPRIPHRETDLSGAASTYDPRSSYQADVRQAPQPPVPHRDREGSQPPAQHAQFLIPPHPSPPLPPYGRHLSSQAQRPRISPRDQHPSQPAAGHPPSLMQWGPSPLSPAQPPTYGRLSHELFSPHAPAANGYMSRLQPTTGQTQGHFPSHVRPLSPLEPAAQPSFPRQTYVATSPQSAFHFDHQPQYSAIDYYSHSQPNTHAPHDVQHNTPAHTTSSYTSPPVPPVDERHNGSLQFYAGPQHPRPPTHPPQDSHPLAGSQHSFSSYGPNNYTYRLSPDQRSHYHQQYDPPAPSQSLYPHSPPPPEETPPLDEDERHRRAIRFIAANSRPAAKELVRVVRDARRFLRTYLIVRAALNVAQDFDLSASSFSANRRGMCKHFHVNRQGETVCITIADIGKWAFDEAGETFNINSFVSHCRIVRNIAQFGSTIAQFNPKALASLEGKSPQLKKDEWTELIRQAKKACGVAVSDDEGEHVD